MRVLRFVLQFIHSFCCCCCCFCSRSGYTPQIDVIKKDVRNEQKIHAKASGFMWMCIAHIITSECVYKMLKMQKWKIIINNIARADERMSSDVWTVDYTWNR